jgi:hypothetical protein
MIKHQKTVVWFGFGVVPHALGGAKSARKMSGINQISIFGPHMWMGLCHGIGQTAWGVGCVFAGL